MNTESTKIITELKKTNKTLLKIHKLLQQTRKEINEENEIISEKLNRRCYGD